MMGNDQDDWEVAVDTGEFDKRLAQLEKDRAATQEFVPSSTFSTVNDIGNRNFSPTNSTQSYKPIRILKRPSGATSTPVNNDFSNSNTISTTDNRNSPFPDETPAATTVSFTSMAPRHPSREPTNSSSSTKPAIKTYEQREQEYRLARLRIMGEEESSTKDDEGTHPLESNTSSSLASNSKAGNTLDSSCQPPSHGAYPVSSS